MLIIFILKGLGTYIITSHVKRKLIMLYFSIQNTWNISDSKQHDKKVPKHTPPLANHWRCWNIEKCGFALCSNRLRKHCLKHKYQNLYNNKNIIKKKKASKRKNQQDMTNHFLINLEFFSLESWTLQTYHWTKYNISIPKTCFDKQISINTW
jgi:hypothetical protein